MGGELVDGYSKVQPKCRRKPLKGFANCAWLSRRARLLETVLIHDGRPPSCVVDIGQEQPCYD